MAQKKTRKKGTKSPRTKPARPTTTKPAKPPQTKKAARKVQRSRQSSALHVVEGVPERAVAEPVAEVPTSRLSPARSAPLAPPSRQRFEPSYEQHRALQLRWLHVDQQLSHAQIAEHVGVDVRTVRSWFSSPVFVRWWNGRLRKLAQSLDGSVALRLAQAALNPAAEDRAAARASHWFLAHFGPRARTERKPKQDGGLAALIQAMQPNSELVIAARRSPDGFGSGTHTDAVQVSRGGEGCSEITASSQQDQSVSSSFADDAGGQEDQLDDDPDPEDIEFEGDESDEQEPELKDTPREPGGARPPRIRDD